MGAQQRGEESNAEHQGGAASLPLEAGFGTAPQALVAAFYRGLGVPADAATPAIRRRELAIGNELVQAGATAAEAEAYARQARTTVGRIAPVDLRSYERERLSWLSRAGRTGGGMPLLVDRTGQGPHGSASTSPPPQQHTDAAAIARQVAQGNSEQPRSAGVGAIARALFGGSP
jgi:hypothetical protein